MRVNKILEKLEGQKIRYTLNGHKEELRNLSWSPCGNKIASSSDDGTVCIWDSNSGQLITKIYGDSGKVFCVAWSPDEKRIAISYEENLIKVLSAKNMELCFQRKLKGYVYEIIWSPDSERLAIVELENIHLIDNNSGEIIETFYDIGDYISWSPDGNTIASVSLYHNELKFIDIISSKVFSVQIQDEQQIGMYEYNYSVDWSPDGKLISIGSDDGSISIFNYALGRVTDILLGHTESVTVTSFSSDGLFFASKSMDGTVRIWVKDGMVWKQSTILNESVSKFCPPGLQFHPSDLCIATLGEKNKVIHIWDFEKNSLLKAENFEETVQYVNAKVVLVGEKSVGKTALSIRIAEDNFRKTESTHGANFLKISIDPSLISADYSSEVQAEVILWDLAGQSDYHLVHQLFLDNTDAALLLFDCSDPDNPFSGVHYWAKVLAKQTGRLTRKYLIAARSDVSPVTVEQQEIDRIVSKYNLNGFFKTSSKTGAGVSDLLKKIILDLDLNVLTRTTTSRLLLIIRDLLLEYKESGKTFVEMKLIKEEVSNRYNSRKVFQDEIDNVVKQLMTSGLIYRIDNINDQIYILLQPELVNRYASSIIHAARNNPNGMGAISELDVIYGRIPFNFDRLEKIEEKLILEATIELFIKYELCFREMGQLVFPSQFNKTKQSIDENQLSTEVSYEFSGSIEAIYASLVVRLSYTNYFLREQQWKNAAEFSRDGYKMGFTMTQVNEGTNQLDIYFYTQVNPFDRVSFIRFIKDHLKHKGIEVKERILVQLNCKQCGNKVENRKAIEDRINRGKLDIACQYCDDYKIMIPSSIEEVYKSNLAYQEIQKELKTTVSERTKQELKTFKNSRREFNLDSEKMIKILHISDLHIGTESTELMYTQLETDLKRELETNTLNYLVISGDIANRAVPEEYENAFSLINKLVSKFGLDSNRVVIVPGNHDVNWDLSKEAYKFVYSNDLKKTGIRSEDRLTIPAGEAGYLLQDENLYKDRFRYFNENLYKKIYNGASYPLEYENQGLIQFFNEDRILFLTLNSCWELDHHYKNRATVNKDSLAKALQKLEGTHSDWIKIAVWHHPVTGAGAMDNEFMELLSVNGFQICMQGHIHEAQQGLYKYDERYNMEIIGAGAFGAPTRQQVTGIPLQYNLLKLDIDEKKVIVESRKKEKVNGAWSADARWGNKNNPEPRYNIELERSHATK